MDKKYQDIHLYNWKTHQEKIIRKIQIERIFFTATEIIIEFKTTKIVSRLVLPKLYNSITID